MNQLPLELADTVAVESKIKPDGTGKKVLFVDYGNNCRSVMAHMLFNFLAPDFGLTDEALSAGSGVRTSRPIVKEAAVALYLRGIKSSGNHQYDYYVAKMLTKKLLDWADTVVPFEEHHAKDITARFPGNEAKLEFLPRYIKNPNGGTFSEHQYCLYTIEFALREMFFS